jgi:hypothetical protein
VAVGTKASERRARPKGRQRRAGPPGDEAVRREKVVNAGRPLRGPWHDDSAALADVSDDPVRQELVRLPACGDVEVERPVEPGSSFTISFRADPTSPSPNDVVASRQWLRDRYRSEYQAGGPPTEAETISAQVSAHLTQISADLDA